MCGRSRIDKVMGGLCGHYRKRVGHAVGYRNDVNMLSDGQEFVQAPGLSCMVDPKSKRGI